MEYLGQEIKKLGFGLMRLPMNGDETDIEQTKKMVDLFMQNGFNYFDTAYVYGDGQSEYAARDALVKRYDRESFILATKLPAWDKNLSIDEVKKRFYTSLERTQAGYFDYYLLHNLGGERTDVYEYYGLWDFVKELKEKGLIKHYGFSFHDNAETLEKILIAHPEAEFVQLQINYLDWESQRVESRKCYEVARKYNKPIIIMEPVKGGSLATLPDKARELLAKIDKDASPASWAIRFAASLEGVITVLSGMSNLEQMENNLSYMKDFKPLTELERETVFKARDIIEEIPQIPCTNCAYCVKDCPQNIPINKILGAINYHDKFNNLSGGTWRYNESVKNMGMASNCIECKACESVCPQHIEITEHLKRAKEIFE